MQPCEVDEYVEYCLGIDSHDYGGPQCDLASLRNIRFVLGQLPRFGNVDAKAPVRRHSGLIATNDPCRLVVGSIVSMRVDRGSAHLKPDFRWACCPFDRKSDGSR